MKIIRNLDDIGAPLRRAVITIGNFDGVHVGHQALFREVVRKARSIDGTAAAMTFEPHPMQVLRKNYRPPLITLLEQKIELIGQTDLDVLICMPFTRQFASLTPREFVEDILIRKIGMAAVVVGRDYSFGRHREGNVALMRTFAELFDFELITADWVKPAGAGADRISSTKIRQLIMEGRVDLIRPMLGRCYQLRGTVTTGRNRGGKMLGFPTANLNLQEELCPKTGVYAVTVEWSGRSWDAVANIGWSPTFDDHLFTVEAHILDFNQDIYGEKIRINFVRRIRDEIRFAGVAELSDQIRRDVVEARRILERERPDDRDSHAE